MEIFEKVRPIRAFLGRYVNNSIGLVPTMGALHNGHLQLIKESKKENDLTIATVYVNPTQFNNTSDLDKYPRSIEKDIELLASEGCDVLFSPSNHEMYPKPSLLKMDFGQLDKMLEGEFRPGHFSGVGLVVSKLFNIIQPTKAYFGQKDFQQYKVLCKLVEELDFNINLECVPTLREEDGLAMSSRNQRLDAPMRAKAIVFYKALLRAKKLLLEGASMQLVRQDIKHFCEAESGVKLEYIELATRENLILTDNVNDANNLVLLIAGFVGEVRLIDNIFLS